MTPEELQALAVALANNTGALVVLALPNGTAAAARPNTSCVISDLVRQAGSIRAIMQRAVACDAKDVGVVAEDIEDEIERWAAAMLESGTLERGNFGG